MSIWSKKKLEKDKETHLLQIVCIIHLIRKAGNLMTQNQLRKYRIVTKDINRTRNWKSVSNTMHFMGEFLSRNHENGPERNSRNLRQHAKM